MGRVIGRRRADFTDPSDLIPGDYCQRGRGSWWVCCPSEQNGGGHLDHRWKVKEHVNGTITVDPSIRLKAGKVTIYHGHLTRGVWTD